ncbi:MAG: homoserine O-acetyltransferase [Arachnia propionica]|nr:MAG: homoserine O-acetyltransferase [Arachnia propionica]
MTPPRFKPTDARTVRLFADDAPLSLAGGETIAPVDVHFETYGRLNQDRSNAIFICHALTGDAHAAGWRDGDQHPGWWDTMIGPGKPVDTDVWFVVCPNLLGGCQGTTGPASINPDTGEAYGVDFPLLSMADFVTVHRALAQHLGIDCWAAIMGGSLGGMQVLEWMLRYPDDARNAIVIAASSRLTAQNIAFSAVGRQAIMRDPDFNGGNFHAADTSPRRGLSVARMLAHITYLSETAFAEKFDRNREQDSLIPSFGVDFAVESYLEYQGEKFLDRFDALSYLYLSRVMDHFDPFADPTALHRLAERLVRFLVISFDSDWRYSTQHSRRIVRRLEAAKVPVSFREVHSTHGHDSFLLAIEEYLTTVAAFLDRAAGELT